MENYKSKILLAGVILMIALLVSCTVATDIEDDVFGEIPLTMNLATLEDLGYEVSRVHVTISCGNYNSAQDLTINGSLASGTFSNLEPGIYNIFVEIFEGETLIATGSGSAEVIAGETVEVEISVTLLELTGNLVITIDLSDLLPPEPHHILFLGNSYTAYNGGLNNHVAAIASALNPVWEIDTFANTPGGCTLEMHSTNETSLAEINSGIYDYVILQEQSTRPIDDPDLFYEYAAVLDSLITENGSQTAFFMTWARENDPGMINGLAAAYTFIGTELNAPVCPVGLAFAEVRLQHPEIELYAVDGSHPSWQGTYLAALVIYAQLWNENPVGCTYIPDPSINHEEAEILQTIAWEVVNNY
ncbi:MAG: hypothetical protein K9N06_10175 [Candidatus Cloacimonetes bacterium]|nr:hypothetical protein [Candidatus Cloacimonadota bacterium]